MQLSNAQFLKKLGQKLIEKGLTEGVDAVMQNTSLTVGGKIFTFKSEINEYDFSKGIQWKVIIPGNEEFISVYRDINLQNSRAHTLKGSDYSFDLFILSDTAIVISHVIKRQPYNEEYPNGPKFSLFLIADSVIYLNNFDNGDTFKAIVLNKMKGEGFEPFVRFSDGKIYNPGKSNEPMGSYRYFNPAKVNFIVAAIYYKATYGNISEQLLTDKLRGIQNYRAEWSAKEKVCDDCSKRFTGLAVKIKSKVNCSTAIEDGGLWGRTSAPNLFCTEKCAEQYCIKMK